MLEGFPPGLRDRFEPQRVLGKGAMGTVYLATRRSDEAEVAIKVVREKGSATLRDRFLREAKSQARIEHPHVLRIFDWGQEDGEPYLVMEVLEGRSLELGPVDYDPLEVMLQIADGLEAVHAAKLVHRDLKPANIFLCRDGRAVLTDFGLVRDPDLTALTRTGQVVGSLGYLPPEVLLGERPGPASDWYAWGVCLFRMREGSLPYAAEDLISVAQGDPLPRLGFEVMDPSSAEADLLRRQLSSDRGARRKSRAAIEEFLRAPSSAATSKTRSPVEGGTGGRGRRLSGVRVAGLVLAAGLVGGLWLGEGEDASSAPVPTRAPASPLGEGFGLQVREQLSAAGELMVDEAGGVRELPDGPIPGRWRPLVNADPHHFPLLLAGMPALERWYAFLGAGGEPEALPPEQREELRRADERFRVVGYPAPFGPFLEGTASPLGAERQPGLEWESRVPWPDRPGPWLSRAQVAFQRGFLERRRLARQLPELRTSTHRFLDDGTRIQLELFLGAQNPLSSTLRELARAPTSRPFVGAWTRTGTEHLTTFLYAIGRSLREEPETARAAAILAHVGLDRMQTYHHTVIAWIPRWALLGPAVEGLPRRFLEVALRRDQLSGRGALSPRRAEEVAAIMEAAWEVLARGMEAGDYGARVMVDQAVGDLAWWAAREGDRRGEWLEGFQAYLPAMARSPESYPEIWRAVVDLCERRSDEFRSRPGLVQTLIPILEARLRTSDEKRRKQTQGCLRDLRAMLR